MTTQFIGVKELSQNLSKILKESKANNVHYIVMKHNVPIVHITPATKEYERYIPKEAGELQHS